MNKFHISSLILRNEMSNLLTWSLFYSWAFQVSNIRFLNTVIILYIYIYIFNTCFSTRILFSIHICIYIKCKNMQINSGFRIAALIQLLWKFDFSKSLDLLVLLFPILSSRSFNFRDLRCQRALQSDPVVSFLCKYSICSWSPKDYFLFSPHCKILGVKSLNKKNCNFTLYIRL